MIVFIINDFFMRIGFTKILKELIYEQLEVPCVPTGDTVYVDVDISVYDVMNNGAIIKSPAGIKRNKAKEFLFI